MRKASWVIAVLVLVSTFHLAVTILPGNVRATTLYVGGAGPGNYTTIQDAINASTSGDTVFVYGGSYHEHVVIDKPLTLIGEDRLNTTIDGDGYGNVVNITADWVNMSQITIANSGQTWLIDSGILISNASNCTVSDSMILNNSVGIGVYQSNDAKILRNLLQGNKVGSHLEDSDSVNVTQNTFNDSRLGAFLVSSDYTFFEDNMLNASRDGIEIWLSDWTVFNNNTLLNTLDWGIFLWASNHSTFHDNEIHRSGDYAIGIDDSKVANITNNSLTDNQGGIRIGYADACLISGNNISNSGSGIRFVGSDGNRVVDNMFLNNSMAIILRSSTNSILLNNTMTVSGVEIRGDTLASWNTHVLDSSNTVDGKPIIYWKNITTGTVPTGIAQVILANCSQVIVENQSIHSNYTYAAAIAFSSDVLMRNVSFPPIDFSMGVYLAFSENVSIIHSFFATMYGIETTLSGNISVIDSEFLGSLGLSGFYSCNNVSFANNTFSSATYTLEFGLSSNMTFARNSGNDLLILYLNNVENGSAIDNSLSKIGIGSWSSNNVTVARNANLIGLDLNVDRYFSILNNTFEPVGTYAMALYGVFNTNITGNVVSNSVYGIHAKSTANNTIAHNTLGRNDVGLYLNRSYSNTVQNNTFFDNFDANLILEEGQGNMILGNTVTQGGTYGFNLRDCDSNVVKDNTISYTTFGLRLLRSYYTHINNNTIMDSSYGLYSTSGLNAIVNNTISNNGNGVYLSVSSGGNRIHHNNFSYNTVQADDDGFGNSWDNGYPSGGNYWSDYSGIDLKNGPNQDLFGSDGIGDTSYTISSQTSDRYPLMLPFEINHPLPPTLLSAHLSGFSSRDVTVSWKLSPDDDSGTGSVIGYEVYRGSSFDPQGAGYSLVASLSNGTSEFVDILAGEGDPNNHFYLVCAKDLSNSTRCSMNQAAKFTKSLSVGLNLISFPLIQSNESVESVLRTVSFDAVHKYDSQAQEWVHYAVQKPHLGKLLINHTSGIWVSITSDSNFTVAGLVPIQTIISLKAGWNLVGYPSFNSSYTTDDLRIQIGATRLEGYDPTKVPYYLRKLFSAGMLAGRGYWVWVDTDVTWTVTNY